MSWIASEGSSVRPYYHHMVSLPDVTADYMLRDFLSFEAPEGYRAELIDREIVLTPPPDGHHCFICGEIIRQVVLRLTARKSRVNGGTRLALTINPAMTMTGVAVRPRLEGSDPPDSSR
jgi:hypothetical protein